MKWQLPNPIMPASIRVGGELRAMMAALFKRLHAPLYQYNTVVRCQTHEACPGDWYGREVLALTALSQALGRETPLLRELVERLPQQLNEQGYFGRVVPEMFYDETKTASHNFLLRSLCEYHVWKDDPVTLTIAKQIADSLFIPLTEIVQSYPDHDARRSLPHAEAVIGMDAGTVGKWRLCSDTGVLFFALDCLSQVAQLTGSPALARSIDAMLARYTELNLLAIRAQTHATLTAARALLRLYRVRRDARYLQLALDRYQLYKQHAWTEDYQNYNWFERPKWTEGCAVADSLLVACQLWQCTGDANYLNDFHFILYSGMRHNQWPNGGFGTTSCLGADGDHNMFLSKGEEATWCCTMHGANALAYAAQSAYFSTADSLILPHYTPSVAAIRFPEGELVLRQHTNYPYEGSVRLEVTQSNIPGEKQLHFFIPAWAPNNTIRLSVNRQERPVALSNSFVTLTTHLTKGDVIELNFGLGLRQEPLLRPHRLPGYCRYFHGPIMLGCVTDIEVAIDLRKDAISRGRGIYELRNMNLKLSPLNFRTFKSMADAKRMKVQFLFKNLGP